MYTRYPLIKKILISILLSLNIVLITEAAGPRPYGKSGTATTTNSQVTVPFSPAAICIENKSTTIDLYADWWDGVATTADNSTNFKFSPGKVYCFSTNNQNPLGTMVIGLITGSSTADYNIQAIAAK